MTTDREYRWHPWGDPIPEGWADDGPAPGHHAVHSRMISRAVSGTPPSVVAVEHDGGVALSGGYDGKPFLVPLSVPYALQLAGELLLIAASKLRRQGGAS